MSEIAREAEGQRHNVEASRVALAEVSRAAELLGQAATRSRAVICKWPYLSKHGRFDLKMKISQRWWNVSKDPKGWNDAKLP